MNNKTIDINQRIPMGTLHTALESFLNGRYTDDYILEQLRLDFTGENRLKKSLRIINKIILRSPLNNFIVTNNDSLKQAIKRKGDRDVILIALLNSAFVFSFDALRFLGKYLSVQDLVNKATIQKALSGVYGGNRATDNAIDSVIPMFIEAGFIKRSQLAVYERNMSLQITAGVTKQIYIESFKVNSALDALQDYQLRDPYFLFIDSLD